MHANDVKNIKRNMKNEILKGRKQHRTYSGSIRTYHERYRGEERGRGRWKVREESGEEGWRKIDRDNGG
jgi:hypothetical protein